MPSWCRPRNSEENAIHFLRLLPGGVLDELTVDRLRARRMPTPASLAGRGLPQGGGNGPHVRRRSLLAHAWPEPELELRDSSQKRNWKKSGTKHYRVYRPHPNPPRGVAMGARPIESADLRRSCGSHRPRPHTRLLALPRASLR